MIVNVFLCQIFKTVFLIKSKCSSVSIYCDKTASGSSSPQSNDCKSVLSERICKLRCFGCIAVIYLVVIEIIYSYALRIRCFSFSVALCVSLYFIRSSKRFASSPYKTGVSLIGRAIALHVLFNRGKDKFTARRDHGLYQR